MDSKPGPSAPGLVWTLVQNVALLLLLSLSECALAPVAQRGCEQGLELDGGGPGRRGPGAIATSSGTGVGSRAHPGPHQGACERIARMAAAAKHPSETIPATPPATAATTDRADRPVRAARYVSIPPPVANGDRVGQVKERSDKRNGEEDPGRRDANRPNVEARAAPRPVGRAGRDLASWIHRLSGPQAIGSGSGAAAAAGCAGAADAARCAGAADGARGPRLDAASAAAGRFG